MTEQRLTLIIAIVSNDDGKKVVGLDWQKNNSALANPPFCTFFAVVARQPTAWNFQISRFMEDGNTRQDFLFSFVKLDIIFWNPTPEKIANLWQTRKVWIRAMKSETAQIPYLGEVFSGVVVVVALSPYFIASILSRQLCFICVFVFFIWGSCLHETEFRA